MKPYSTIYFDLGDTLIVSDNGQKATWVPGALETLGILKNAGYQLGVISNTGNLTRDELSILLPAEFSWELFSPQLVLLSSEVGVEKPDPTIFKIALQRAGVPASEILFCTESLRDTLAAQAAGLRAARVVPAQQGSDITKLPDILTDLH